MNWLNKIFKQSSNPLRMSNQLMDIVKKCELARFDYVFSEGKSSRVLFVGYFFNEYTKRDEFLTIAIDTQSLLSPSTAAGHGIYHNNGTVQHTILLSKQMIQLHNKQEFATDLYHELSHAVDPKRQMQKYDDQSRKLDIITKDNLIEYFNLPEETDAFTTGLLNGIREIYNDFKVNCIESIKSTPGVEYSKAETFPCRHLKNIKLCILDILKTGQVDQRSMLFDLLFNSGNVETYVDFLEHTFSNPKLKRKFLERLYNTYKQLN